MKNPFLTVYRITGVPGDSWGTCLSWLFAICDYLTDYHMLPDYIGDSFKQGLCGSDTESYEYQCVVEMINDGQATIDDLLRFTRVLWRYRTWLQNAGLDY